MRRLRFIAMVVVSVCVVTSLTYAASITLTQVTSNRVTATIQPDSSDIGKPANVWVGALYGGTLYLRDADNWTPYKGGAIPFAIGNTTQSALMSMNIVDGLDVSLLHGLELYVGYGTNEWDMLNTPGKLARVYPGTPVPTDVVNLANLSVDAYAKLGFNATITGVTIAGRPVVKFKVTDQNGTPVVGLGSKARASTATVANYQNLTFTLAKLVPGGNGSPSKWVSYIVTTVPTTTAAATATRPTGDNTGSLLDSGDGSYTYTFYRDITQIKSQVAGLTLTGLNVAADLGDLTYEPSLTHRLAMSIAGSVPGTGSNTADAIQIVPAVPFAKPNNTIYDFIPATGKAVASTDSQRLIVDKLSCNECHGKLGGLPGTASVSFHAGNRYEPRFCVVCHTDQRKFGQARVFSTNNTFPTGNTYVADGITVGDLPVLIHRLHSGELLVKKGYNYAGVQLNVARFPQDIRNCTKCHDSTAPKVAPQAENYKNVPSRQGCSGCHDGIDFATGSGTTNAGANTGHLGGARADDKLCTVCHSQNDIPVYHIAVTPPNSGNALVVNAGNVNTHSAWIASNPGNLPTGAINVSYDLSSVSRNASKQPVMVFRILQDGVRADFKSFDATKAVASQELWDNFFGSPSAYFVFSVPQDGIAAPADFNVTAPGYIRNIWNGTATDNGAGTLTGPDANGYYTLTLTVIQVPDSAVMLTGGLGYTYNVINMPPLTQSNLAAYPVAASTTTGVNPNNPNKTGGLIVIARNAQMVATGYTGRRLIVEDKRCDNCHLELGMFTDEAFHAGQRNDASTCSWCHNPNRTSSGWSADSTSDIHAIHAASKRTTKFTWHATTTSSYANVGYPGILSACETCHLPGTYDFSAAASASAVPNRQYRTVGQGKYDASIAAFSISPYVTADNVTSYGAGFSFNASAIRVANITKADGSVVSIPAQGIFNAERTTLVNSPITAACFSCHDSQTAMTHMRTNGGSIYAPRASALANTEQCLACHGNGTAKDIKMVHTSF